MPLGRAMHYVRRISEGVRSYGLSYLLRAPGNELRNPRLAATRRLRASLAAIGDRVRPRRAAPMLQDCLLFACDLGASPVTFDFATFLAGAELERRKRGLDGIFVLFVPGDHDGLRRELPAYESALPSEQRQWRVRHILVPLLALLPSIRGYALCATRQQAAAVIGVEADLVPENYRVWLPRQPDKLLVHDHAAAGIAVWPLLRAPEHARAVVFDFLRTVSSGRYPLVITLRHSPAYSARNSRIEEWRQFVARIDRRRFAPVFVYDTEAVLAAPPELRDEIFCDVARWNVEIRMALYEAAWLNMAVMHGPMELCWYNHKTRYVVFLDTDADPTSSVRAVTEGGLRVGRDLPFAAPFQRIVWGPDLADALGDAFERMRTTIEASAETGDADTGTDARPSNGQLTGG